MQYAEPRRVCISTIHFIDILNSLILICIWLICRLIATLYVTCCGAVWGRKGVLLSTLVPTQKVMRSTLQARYKKMGWRREGKGRVIFAFGSGTCITGRDTGVSLAPPLYMLLNSGSHEHTAMGMKIKSFVI